MPRVLFICEGNRARSQLAEAMLRHHGAGRFEAFSAGIRPGNEVPGFTVRALDEAHYPSAGLRSKHFSEFGDEEFDFLIVLCDTVRAEGPDLPHARTRLDWPVEDPGDAQKRGVSIEDAIRANMLDLRSRIVRFMEAQGCVFCAIVRGDMTGSFVYRDAEIAAFMDIRPVTEGHVLVIPLEHWLTMDEVPAPIAGRMTSVASDIAKALQSAGVRMEGYNLFVANGEAAGQEVFHVHMHVIPRFPGDGFGFRFPPGYGRIEERARLNEMAERIRGRL
jgi:diadenosine tetraphosphate (Ap4A) HIT family hydrolase/protein-tyrosine-phosphatase